MNSVSLLISVLVLYSLAYFFYGRFLSKLFQVNPHNVTPAHTERDDIDFVPAKNPWILFGHHFSSICGAGPIVGPVLACAYWGWGISAIWIVVGAIWMGAVSDFSALVMSLRAKGISITQVAGSEISKRVRVYFAVFVWISLILVIAVFAIFAAKTFIEEPDAVLPSVGLIPVALLTGWLLYRTKCSNTLATLLGVTLMILLTYGGVRYPLLLPDFGGMSSQTLWIIFLLIYCFAASVLPVQSLLQPRDYLASFILFGMIILGVAGVFVSRPELNAPFFTSFSSKEIFQTGPLWPMLFVTIACGAISGFHALVSSGTTCKQIDSEGHACGIGYGGMLVESLVGILVVIAVAGGLSSADLTGLLKSGGPIAAFGHGFGKITVAFLGDYGKAFAILALNAFILTTLDTATRIARYITAEVFGIKNMYAATAIVVLLSAFLALSGRWNLLWPAFGAANQLIAGITLLVASCWLLNRGRNYWLTLIPAGFMLLTTAAAFGYQFFQAVLRVTPEGKSSPDWIIAFICVLLIAVAFSVLFETFKQFRIKASEDLITVKNEVD